ncbi:hypothetical protein K456DRAFT_52351 [Colletotrichum gloeosporioides 23]|nr:hypothetical protein K456DRAFT_52351 [Colletotrichum gloeosporioides 23]
MNLDSKTMQLPPRPGIAELSVTNKVCMCVVLCVFVRGEREKSKRRRMPRNARCSISLQIQTSNFNVFVQTSTTLVMSSSHPTGRHLESSPAQNTGMNTS